MVRKLTSAIVIAGALNAAQVNALGLGELTLHSALNEPLDAEIKLLNIGDLTDNQIIVQLASREDFETAGVDRAFFLTNFKFEVKVNPDGTGVIKINTKKFVREPYLDFVIETRWPAGRLLREYTALLDLPVYKQESESTVNLGHQEGYTPASTMQPTEQQGPREAATSSSMMPMRSTQPAYDGDTYRIQNNDTLWTVANRVKPGDDVSVQQTMVAIQRLNPHAFIHENINLLRAGSVIRVPDREQINNVSTREAIQEVAMQNLEWREGITGAAMDARASEAGGAMAATQEGGRLSLTSASGSGAGGTGGDAEGLRNQLAVAQDQLEASERDREELQSEVAKMREQVETLQRMVELKDQKLAEAQAQLGGEEVAESPAEMEPESAAPEMESAETEGAEAEGGEAAMEAEEPMETAETEAAAAKPIEKPKPKPAPMPAPKPEKGFVEQFLSNPLYWGGALLLVIAAVVALVLKLRSGAAEEEEYTYTEDASEADFEETEEATEEAVAELEEAEAEEALEEEAAEEEIEEAPAAAQSETGDAIGEADIYVAYGRYQHAIDLLKNAIGGEPERMDLRLKLLEVYLEAGDKEGFKDQFAVLQTMGDQEALAKAKELLSTVDGASDWLSGEAMSGAGDEFEEDALGELDLDLGDEQEDFATTPETAESDIEDVELQLDEIDDLSEDEGEVTLEFDAIDDGNDLDLSESLNEDIGIDESDELALGETEDLGLNESEELDSNYSLDTVAEESADIELDLDEDFGEDLTDEEPDFSIEEDFTAATEAPVEESFEESFEEALDETLEAPEENIVEDLAATEEQAAPAAPTPAATGGGSEDDLEFLTDADEVATKLDLARAYIEMGDVDGARDILEEVINEGEEAQKAEANRLLERIA